MHFRPFCNSCCAEIEARDFFTDCGHFICHSCFHSEARGRGVITVCPYCSNKCQTVELNNERVSACVHENDYRI